MIDEHLRLCQLTTDVGQELGLRRPRRLRTPPRAGPIVVSVAGLCGALFLFLGMAALYGYSFSEAAEDVKRNGWGAPQFLVAVADPQIIFAELIGDENLESTCYLRLGTKDDKVYLYGPYYDWDLDVSLGTRDNSTASRSTSVVSVDSVRLHPNDQCMRPYRRIIESR